MSAITAGLEQQLLALTRRNPRLLTGIAPGGADLERSSYVILCLLHDHGSQRLGQIAQAFDLDPSTVTRQVQTVVRLGLAERTPDERDRRATILALTPVGREVVQAAREVRRDALRGLMTAWPDDDREAFLRLLVRFNADVETWSRGRSDGVVDTPSTV